MIIDLSKLKKIGSFKDIQRKVNFRDLRFRNRDIETPDPFDLNLNILKTNNSFVFTGELKGELLLECSRCLEKFSYVVNMEVDEEIALEEIEDLEHVDIYEMLLENIYLAISIKPLCSPDCKGLCPQCGQNLNDEQCDCEREMVDPRMEKLKKFFNEEVDE